MAMYFLPALTLGGLIIICLSLRYGWLGAFFYDAEYADVQGIDYFSLPKAFINLRAGRSAYDTFGAPAYGPHLTWYLSHPALAVELGSWLSLLPPWPSYAVFVALSVLLMAAAAAA